jgi:hypothetical protein
VRTRRARKPRGFGRIGRGTRPAAVTCPEDNTMNKQDLLPTIAADALAGATGGATRERSSSTDWQLQQTMQTITDSLRDLKNQNNDSTSKMLPMVMMAKVMRDRNG